jgi:phenylalanine-4-hydroxylase
MSTLPGYKKNASATPVERTPLVSMLMEIGDAPGALHDILRFFWKYDINITRIESRPSKQNALNQPRFDFYVDFESNSKDDVNVQKLMAALETKTTKVLILDEKDVVWFPRHLSELDLIANRTLDAGEDLQSDHPGFNDQTYRERRGELARVAQEYVWDQPIPRIDYTANETETWGLVWDRMEDLLQTHACAEYLKSFQSMKEHCGYSRDTIPQQQDITDYLLQKTGFRMRPVAGLLSSRDFLNGLAFRTFFSTQYIRHHSMPLYTPEPDICHELLGHAPMFADQDFADFSQEIGLASLGASDEDVQALAWCYWHSVEFGLCKEGDEVKAYGAGLLSSFGELEYACAPYRPAGGTEDRPELKPWSPKVAGSTPFPITTYQPIYFVAESLNDAKTKMRGFTESLQKPFLSKYNAHDNSIWIDRPVRRAWGNPNEPAAESTAA